ncbi:MAG TPA: ABC transporter permease [Dehalococcoidales bacterium]
MTEDTYAGTLPIRKKRPFLVDLATRFVKEKPLGTVGAVIVILFLFVGIFANWLAPYDYNDAFVGGKLEAPSTSFWLGTDNVGRDVLSRIIYGARISMFVGLGISGLATVISTIIGMISGFAGGKTDIIIQRFVDAWVCFPGMFVMLTFLAIVGQGVAQLILVLGIQGGIAGSRLARSAVMAIKSNTYVEAARAIGCPTSTILMRHILPNIMAPLIIMFTMGLGGAILAESSISFIGYGIPPPAPTWGGMLSGNARRYMIQAPWLAIFPGLALSIVVYGANMFGDALRDLLDPRLRGGLGRYSGGPTRRPSL